MTYSNRQNVYYTVTNLTNDKPITFPLSSSLRPLEKIQASIYHFRMNNLIDNITPLNNQLHFDTFSITIPPKFYTAIELRDYLNVVLTPHTITCTYENYQFKFVSTHSFTILSTSTCKRVLGLSDSNQSATLYPAYTLVCPSKCDMSQHFITINITELSANWIHSRKNITNTFCKIPINCLYGQVIYFEPSVIYLLQKTNIRSMSIKLLDDYGNELTETPFEIAFKFEFVYVLPNQEIQEEEKKEEDNIDLNKFEHYDGNVKVKSIGGFAI